MSRSKNTSDGTKTTSFLDKVYTSIEDMPIWNWMKVLETGKLEWIFITCKGRVTKKLADHWLALQDEYMDEFGLDETFKQQLRLMEELKNLNCDLVITKDQSILNVIMMTEIDIEGLNNKKVIKFYEMIDHVEKYKGFSIDPKTTSVMKWYYSLKNMSNGKADKGK